MLPGVGEKAGLLQRFRQLVEMNFSRPLDHRPICRGAGHLGRPAARHLHDGDRASRRRRWSRSGWPRRRCSEWNARRSTIHQLGHSLGFNDPAHFSSFFKRMTGMAPSRYRELIGEVAGRRAEPAAGSASPTGRELANARGRRGDAFGADRAVAAGHGRPAAPETIFPAAITQRSLRRAAGSPRQGHPHPARRGSPFSCRPPDRSPPVPLIAAFSTVTIVEAALHVGGARHLRHMQVP